MNFFLRVCLCCYVCSYATTASPRTNNNAKKVEEVGIGITVKSASLDAVVQLQWEQLVQTVPLSVFLLSQLMLVADFKEFPVNMNALQDNKHNLGELLRQVSSVGLEAFTKAHGNMDMIGLQMANISKNIGDIFHTLDSKRATPGQIANNTEISVRRIKISADEANRLAKDTCVAFQTIQELLLAISEAVAGTEGFENMRVKQTRNYFQLGNEIQKQQEQRQNRLKADLAKLNNHVKEAKQKYDNALDRVKIDWQSDFMDVVRTVDVAKIAAAVGNVAKSHNEGNSKIRDVSVMDICLVNSALGIQKGLVGLKDTIEDNYKNKTDQFNKTVENLEILKIAFDLQEGQVDSHSQSPFYPKVKSFVVRAKLLVDHLTNTVKATNEVDNATNLTVIDLLIREGKSFATIIPDITSVIPMELITHPAYANILRPAGRSHERFKAQLQQKHLEMLQMRYDRIFDQQIQETYRLNEILQRHFNMSLSAFDVPFILETLEDVILGISSIHEAWVNMESFFQSISNVAQMTLDNEIAGLAAFDHKSTAEHEYHYVLSEMRYEIGANVVRIAPVADFIHSVSVACGTVFSTYISPSLVEFADFLMVAYKKEQWPKLELLWKQSRLTHDTVKKICEKQRRQFKGNRTLQSFKLQLNSICKLIGKVKSETTTIEKIFKIVGKPSLEDVKLIEEMPNI